MWNATVCPRSNRLSVRQIGRCDGTEKQQVMNNHKLHKLWTHKWRNPVPSEPRGSPPDTSTTTSTWRLSPRVSGPAGAAGVSFGYISKPSTPIPCRNGWYRTSQLGCWHGSCPWTGRNKMEQVLMKAPLQNTTICIIYNIWYYYVCLYVRKLFPWNQPWVCPSGVYWGTRHSSHTGDLNSSNLINLKSLVSQGQVRRI